MESPARVVARARSTRPTAGRSPSVVPLPFQSMPVSHPVRLSDAVTRYIVSHLSPLVVAQETPGVTKKGVPGAWVRATPKRRGRSVEKHDGCVHRLPDYDCNLSEAMVHSDALSSRRG